MERPSAFKGHDEGPERPDCSTMPSRAALASGRAEPALALLVDVLMEMRGISERDGEIISGAALETEAPVEMSPNALDMVFACDRARGGGDQAAGCARLCRTRRASGGAPVSHPRGRGATRLGLCRPGHPHAAARPARARRRAEMIRVEAGGAVPWHTHKGQELTLCLIGEFSDSRGVYGPGDCSISDPTIRHHPARSQGGHGLRALGHRRRPQVRRPASGDAPQAARRLISRTLACSSADRPPPRHSGCPSVWRARSTCRNASPRTARCGSSQRTPGSPLRRGRSCRDSRRG